LRCDLSSFAGVYLDLLSQYNHLFVAGDLNYRLNFPASNPSEWIKRTPDPLVSENNYSFPFFF
jgi:hypothetical protein